MKHRIGSVDHAKRGRRNNNGHDAQGSRCGLHRRRVYRQHSRPRTDQGRAQGRRARARRRPFDTRGFHTSLRARRSQIRGAPGTVPGYADRDGNAAALAFGNRAASAAARLLPSDHNLRSHLQNRYGRDAIPAEMTIEDYPVSYDELEPYYDRFEKLCGISGKAGNLRGQIVAGGNVFEGARQNEYPNRPLVQTMAGSLMEKAAKDLGYHPFPAPSANMSSVYTNPEGVTLGAC